MTPDGLALLKSREACRFTAYLDSGHVATIGWGTTRYPDGHRVAIGDTCTQAEADAWIANDVDRIGFVVSAATRTDVLPRQLDALTSFAYNLGEDAYRMSGLRRAVNANPNDPAIRAEFMKWYFVDHTPVRGLWIRRHAEADHYFGVATLCPPMPNPSPPLAA